MDSKGETVTLIKYLYTRLHQIGIRALHGVPGDYNLVALDYVEENGLNWIGDANELNSAYSADGYARVKGIGALVTTYGVGELSAINGVAGSFSENIPVVHIVGSPSTTSQEAKMLLHHTLGNGNFDAFREMYKHITIAQASLTDAKTAPEQIDNTLRECWLHSRPVYIEVPTNMVLVDVDAAKLSTNIDLSPVKNSAAEESALAADILERLYSASNPVIIVDGLVSRFRLTEIVDKLVRTSGIPTVTTPIGKSDIDETLPNFLGTYAGVGTPEALQEYVDKSDFTLHIGPILSDYNTTGFTYKLVENGSIQLYPEYTNIAGKRHDIQLHGLVARLSSELDSSKIRGNLKPNVTASRLAIAPGGEKYPSNTITQNYLWTALSEWLRPDDVLLTETGTAYMGMWETSLPKGVKLISQGLWGSIGYTLPSAQGAALAAKELGRSGRVILFEGDGSMQLTAQAIGTMIKEKLDIIIILINNDGYTIERWVHGMDAPYNDIAVWKYAQIPEAMGATKETATVYTARTIDDLEALWKTKEFQNPKGMHFVEMFMPKYDAPPALKLVAEAAAKTNEE